MDGQPSGRCLEVRVRERQRDPGLELFPVGGRVAGGRAVVLRGPLTRDDRCADAWQLPAAAGFLPPRAVRQRRRHHPDARHCGRQRHLLCGDQRS